MKVHVVSDVHGATDALSRALGDADALICLGDLIHFIDYTDYSGIMADLFGVEAVRELVTLRADKRFDEARTFSQRLWADHGGDRWATLEKAIREQYAEMFAAFPTPTYLTYGNVDLPHLYPDYLRPGITLLDGEVVEIGGRTFGFVGGGLQTPMRTPMEIPDDEYAAKVAAVGKVDVLCCHIPPQVDELVYDRLADRHERGSVAVLDAIRDTQPDLCLFGHVHNPVVSRLRIGRTECVNVGHFRGHGSPYALEW
ncbi:MAG TPA: metallophosphoesterase [Mycobacteriales bacterium]|nr:metallophosphoesterase [Mycobacteriales bacterium]